MSAAPLQVEPRPSPAQAASQASIDRFLDALWLEDGLSANTLAAYRRDLSLYADWLAREHGRSLEQTTETDLLAYAAWRHAGSRSSSVSRRLSTFRRYFRWALREGRLPADPTLRLDAPKPLQRLPGTLTEAQVEALLAAPDVDTPWKK